MNAPIASITLVALVAAALGATVVVSCVSISLYVPMACGREVSDSSVPSCVWL
jgi:hypothetical protein